MPMYCSVCGDELEPEEEMEGICESCKLAASGQTSADEIEPQVQGIMTYRQTSVENSMKERKKKDGYWICFDKRHSSTGT